MNEQYEYEERSPLLSDTKRTTSFDLRTTGRDKFDESAPPAPQAAANGDGEATGGTPRVPGDRAPEESAQTQVVSFRQLKGNPGSSNMAPEPRGRQCVMSLLSFLWAYRKTIILIVTPLASLPLVLVIGDGPSRGAFVIIIMAVYWIMEVLPLAVTALLPVILYPLLGVQDSDDVCRNYLKDTNFLFVGGLIVAVAVEHWAVHRRFALGVLLLMGSKLRWLMLGFMLTTAFLSMWISNTATTAMMIPIAQSVVMQLLKQRKVNQKKREARRKAVQQSIEDPQDYEAYNKLDETTFNGHVNAALEVEEEKPSAERNVQVSDIEVNGREKEKEAEMEEEEDLSNVDMESLTPEEQKLCKGLLLCVAYAANIGGTATLTGTGPNVVLGGQVDELYGSDSGVTFSSWMLFSLPGTIVNLFLCWLWLQVIFIGFSCTSAESDEDSREEDKSARLVIQTEYRKLGAWSWGQVAVVCHFIVLAFMWLFRNPTFIPGFAGWAGLFPVGDYISDATAAIIISVCLFIFPAHPPWFLRCFRIFRMENDEKPVSRGALLDWKTAQRMLPWNVILLLGGGFALASGTEASGLSQWLADQFKVLDFLPPWVFVLIITVIICFFTEFTSNVATATIFLPILASLAESICINPLYIMLPATISCSYAFMLPVATPPNAIAFAYGSLTVPDMMRAGVVMNIIGIIVVNLLINSMGIVIFDVFNYPDWGSNSAVCLPSSDFSTAFPTYTPNVTCICY